MSDDGQDDDVFAALLLADVPLLRLEIIEQDEVDTMKLLECDSALLVDDAVPIGANRESTALQQPLRSPRGRDSRKKQRQMPAAAAIGADRSGRDSSTRRPESAVPPTRTAETRGRKKQKADAVVNRCRGRQREELMGLRHKVSDLERTLHVLQQKQKLSSVAVQVAPHAAADSTGDSHWQRSAIAQRQCAWRARQENEELRDAVSDHIRFAQVLQRMLKKLPNTEIAAMIPPPRLLPGPFLREFDSAYRSSRRSKIKERLENALCMQSHRIDEVMADVGLATCTTDMHRNRIGVWTDDTGMASCSSTNRSLKLELVEARVFPFAFNEVSRTIWQFFSECQQSMYGGTFHNLEASESKIYGDYSIPSPSWQRSRYEISGAIAIRRCEPYEHGQRDVHMWQALSAFHRKKALQDEAPAFHLHESGWSIVEPLTLSPGRTVAILKFCSRITPLRASKEVHLALDAVLKPPPLKRKKLAVLTESTEFTDARDGGEAQAGTLIDFAIHAHQRDIQLFYRELENRLLAQHLVHKSSNAHE